MSRNRLPALAFLLCIALFLGSAVRADAQASSDQRPAPAATGSIGPAQRRALIDALVEKWGPYVQATYGSDIDVWHDRLTMWFMKADATNLVDALKRDTYDGAMATLIGRGARVSNAGDQAGARLGDTYGDLVYTPVQPCRVVDTRLTVAGPIAAASSRNFIGINLSSFATQGGSATDCGTLNVTATAIAINVTAVTPAGNGYTTVFPYNTTQPLAAALTYGTGAVVNNTVIAQIPNPLSSFDFTVYTFAQSHYVVDIVGYFAPPQATPLQCIQTGDSSVLVNPGAGNTASAGTCPLDYTYVATSCRSTSNLVSFGFIAAGTCGGHNGSAGVVSFTASVTCCRVPGR